MIKSFIITLIALFAIYNLKAPSTQKRITVTKAFAGYKYHINGMDMKGFQLSEFIEKDEEANTMIKKAMFNKTWSNILGTAGGLLIFPGGTLLTGKEPSWSVVGIGAALALTSIPFNIACNKQTKTAVDTYNTNLTASKMNRYSPALSVGINKSGIGFSLSF
jgi:hypothetical protein